MIWMRRLKALLPQKFRQKIDLIYATLILEAWSTYSKTLEVSLSTVQSETVDPLLVVLRAHIINY
jgi:hypothetical protein